MTTGATGEAPARAEVLTRLAPAEVAAVAGLVERVTEVDGRRPLSEHVMLHLRYGGDYDVRHVLVWGTGPNGRDELMGYGHLDVTDPVEGPSAELAVHPAHRRAGVGRAIVAELVGASPDGRLRLWAHGEHAAAGRLARSLGFDRARVLWQMRRSLFAVLPRVDPPRGLVLRAFRPGADDRPWVALNARAFADLPDQGGWTLADLHRRMQEPWFDPAGFLVLCEEATGRMVGFHWTKVHGGDHRHTGDHHTGDPHAVAHDRDETAAVHGHDPIGEVYVVGVDPDEQGRGLGRLLTVAGLRHLRGLGLAQAMLYVDAANVAAIRVYESLGFTRWDTDVQYKRDLTR